MGDKADNPITSGMHAGCVDDALVSMDLSEEERGKLLQVMAKAKVVKLVQRVSQLNNQYYCIMIFNAFSIVLYLKVLFPVGI